jgi:hypothetical protein
MIKEIRYLIFITIISLSIFLTSKYYFSDVNKKNSFRSLNDIHKKIDIYSQYLSILEDDTKNIIEYVKDSKIKKDKKYYFWELIDKNE